MNTLDTFKEQFFKKHLQSVLIQANGTVLENDGELLPIKPNSSIEDVDDFFFGFADMLQSESTFPIDFPCVTLASHHIIADVVVHQLDNNFVFIIEDRTKWYKEFQKMQQERNQKSIENTDLNVKNKNLQLERELLKIKNNEMQRMQAFKTDFFSKVSHELRTPISGIIGLSSLLEGARENSKDSEKFLKSLKSSAGHLQSIVNDVLDMSKIESGKFKLNNAPLNLGELIEDVALSFYYQAQEKGLALKTYITNTLPTWVEADATRIRQILFNLLNNAMKFTSEGYIAIHVSYEAKSSDLYRIVFKIEDTGIGINEKNLGKIFKEYEQATENTQSKYGGTGLGLSVVKQLVQLNGGNISVSSIEGEGTIFSFDLILKSSTNPNTVGNKTLQLHNQQLRILIADDEPINLMILKRHFEEQSAHCVVVNNGLEALKKLETEDYDLLISDVNMPGKTGVELAYALNNKKTKVFLLTGEFMEKSNAVFRDSVVEKAFLKPVNPSELFDAINLLF